MSRLFIACNLYSEFSLYRSVFKSFLSKKCVPENHNGRKEKLDKMGSHCCCGVKVCIGFTEDSSAAFIHASFEEINRTEIDVKINHQTRLS